MRPLGARVWSGRLATACALFVALAAALRGAAASAAPTTPPLGVAEGGEPATPPAGATAPDAPAAASRSVAELYRDFADAIVRVAIVTDDVDDAGVPMRFSYTGFVISREGRVITSIGDSLNVTRVWIEKDGLDYAAEFLGGDARTHIALVQLLAIPEKFAVIPIDVPNVMLPIGSSVVALSQPLELFDASPSAGLVTGYESGFAQYVFPCSYMRTSVPLGLGEQGAPVLDANGTLAGVMVASLPQLRSSYLVPPNSLQRIIRDLSERDRVQYGSLPLEFAEAPDKPYVARQVVISSVEPGGQAERAGLRPGDVLRRMILETNRQVDLPPSLTSLGDGPIRRISHVRDMLFHALPGERMRIEVERDGQPIPAFNLPVEPLKEPAPAPAATPPPEPATDEAPHPAPERGDPPLLR